MALPAGITPKTVQIGIASFFDGTLVDGTATITAPVNVVHTPTNRPIFSSTISQKFVDGIASFTLAPTDAAGLNRVDWTYKLSVSIHGALVQPEPVIFTLPAAGPDTVDLDGLVTVPSSAGVPISATVVTSVNGQTGDVTVASGTGTATDASSAAKGIVQLAGDLAGTAASPTVPALANKVDTSTYTAGLALKADTASLAAVAQTGSYSDLTNKPTIPAAAPDASASSKGLVQLAGDLAGTATAPTVPALAAKASVAALNLGKLKGSDATRSMVASPPSTPPTITTPPTVSQSAAVTSGLTQTVPVTTDRVRWSGPFAATPAITGTVQPRGATFTNGTINSVGQNAVLAFDTEAESFDLSLYARSTLYYRIWVNEQAVTADMQAATGTNAQAFLNVNFGTATPGNPRRIIIELEDLTNPIGVYNLRVGPTRTVTLPTIASPRVIVVGDSFGVGYGGTRQTFSYAQTLGRMMGWADVWNSSTSISGTGLVKDGAGGTSGHYSTRMAQDVIPYNPDLVIIQGSVNDPNTSVGAALTSYVTTLRASLPNVPIVVTSPLMVANPFAASLSVNTDMKAAAATLGLPYLDILNPALFSGSGTTAAPTGSGNADLYRSADGIHPSDAGHYMLAKVLAGMLGAYVGPSGTSATTIAATGGGTSGAALETTAAPRFGGVAAPGVSTKAAAADHVHPRYDISPTDHGLLGWAYDIIFATNASTVTLGTLQMVRVHVPVACTITNVLLNVAAAGTGLTAGQNFAALYDSNRALLATTADQTTNWASAGVQTMPLATAQTVAAGDYYVGFWVRGTTSPTFSRSMSNLAVNLGTGTSYRFATSTTALTTTAPNPAAAHTIGSVSFWAAIS